MRPVRSPSGRSLLRPRILKYYCARSSICSIRTATSRIGADLERSSIDVHVHAAWQRLLCTREASTIPVSQLNLDREEIFGQSNAAILAATPAGLYNGFRINFNGENGADGGGLFKEWTDLYSSALSDGPLKVNTYSGLLEVNPEETDVEIYRAVGRFLGMVINRGLAVDLKVPLIYYAKMLGLRLRIEDLLEEDRPSYSAIVETGFDPITFSSYPTKEDAEAGVANLLNNLEDVRVNERVYSLTQGFQEVIPPGRLGGNWFKPRDLGLMIRGEDRISVADFARDGVVTFDGPGLVHMDDERKSWIWRALTELENENPGFLSELLQFLTGSSRIPVGGLQNMDPKLKFEIAQKPGADFETSRCPVAHTCINQLDLPLYDSVETLKAKLLYAATNKSGFALR